MDSRGDESIGTLTGWQLLAEQVKGVAAARHSAAGGGGEDGDGDAGSSSSSEHARTPSSKRNGASGSGGLHVRSHSGASDLSQESGLGGAASSTCVTPRPHQWLYKEYKILDEIGSGGFGRVCRARRLADGRIVVVKEINTTSLSAKQKLATMDEVLVLAKLNHPNIVKYHDCYMDAVYINIVMEYCNAGDLAGLIKGREGRLMPEEEVMSLFVQIVLAMQYVHAAGVLHRDLKTSNVLLSREDNFGGMPLLKLGDFGVAKSTGAESMASTIVGTPQYLSPEMCDNKPYGKKSDVWALGCVLYELASLTKAFDVGAGGISGIILKIMRGAYDPLPAGVYSENLVGLVGAMLQTKPRNRPSVADLFSMPYVRHHLGLYLDWARHVPQAHPHVVLASLGELWPRAGSNSLRMSDQAQQAQLLKTIGSGGSGSSLDAPGQQQQQHLLEQQHSNSPRAGSSRAPTPTMLRVSGTGSNSSFAGPASGSAISTDLLRQGSNMSSVRSGSTTPRSGGPPAAAAASQPSMEAPQQPAAPAHTLPPAAPSSGSRGSPFQGSLSPPSPRPPVAAGPPPGSLSGWLGGDTSLQQRLLIQQQVLSAHGQSPPQEQDRQAPDQQQQQQQLSQPMANLELSPQLQQPPQQQQQQQQQQQRRQPRMSCPNPAEMDQLVSSAAAARQQQQQQPHPQQQPHLQQQQQHATAPMGAVAMQLDSKLSAASSSTSADPVAVSSWAYPTSSMDVRPVTTAASSRTSLAQEQIEGLKRIWGLKSRLQVPHGSHIPAAAAAAAAGGAAGAGGGAAAAASGARDQQQQAQQQGRQGPAYADAALNI